MAGFNPYAGGMWQPQATSPYQYPQPTPNGYSGTGSHLYSQQRPVSNLLKVTGPESAKAYQVGPNSSVVLFDANEPIFYLKSTDDSGFATLRTFEFSEKAPDVIDVQAAKPDPVDTSAFATKEDVDSIRKELADISEMLKGLV